MIKRFFVPVVEIVRKALKLVKMANSKVRLNNYKFRWKGKY